MRQDRALAIAIAAFALALLVLGGTALQWALGMGEAVAQSSVRPPDDAVNVETLPGGSVRPPQGAANGGDTLGGSPPPKEGAPGEGTLYQEAPEVQQLPGGSVRPPSDAATDAPARPGVTRPGALAPPIVAEPGQDHLDQQGANSVSDLWSYLRKGGEATVTIPDQNAGVLFQDAGMRWLEWRAKGGPLQYWGGIALLGMLALVALFYLVRGRIRIDAGKSGRTIERFKGYERFAHWLLAVSFVLLALSGLNLLYGKDWILPLIGKEAFATATQAGKWLHNNVAWAFMLALVMVFVIWIAHNLPSRTDLVWLAKGGGLFSKGVHPPSKKFNAGQKLIFWAVVLLGASVSASGLALLFPYQAPLFAKTFVILNDYGLSTLVLDKPLPTDLTPVQEMQYAQIWHAIVGFAMMVVVIAHIYLGSIGMEGAFAAMGSGQVDRNWAREHHSLWVAEKEAREGRGEPHPASTPAE